LVVNGTDDKANLHSFLPIGKSCLWDEQREGDSRSCALNRDRELLPSI
jgi:hypothetical protein